MSRKWKIAFYSWFAIIPLFAILLDIFLSVIQPGDTSAGKEGHFTQYFDLALIDQVIFISVWTAVLTSVFGICNLINLFTKKMPHWITGKNNHTFVTSMSIIVFLTYWLTFIANPDQIVGFDLWYKILKSILEHGLTPIFLVIFYFLARLEPYDSRQYAKKTGWWTIIFPAVYLLFITIRAAMLYSYGPDSGYLTQNGANWQDNVLLPYPYEAINPWEKPVYIWLIADLLLLFAPYGIGNLLNYLSNLSSRSFAKRNHK